MNERTIRLLKATAEHTAPVVLAAAPAWLDKSGLVTIGRRPGDPPAPYLERDALRAAGAQLTAVLPQTGAVLHDIGPAAGASSLTHILHIPEPLYAGHRTWLVQFAETLPTDEAAAEAAGLEHGEMTVDVLPDGGPVQ